MKIKKVSISGFGKLENFTYDLDDGLNTIINDNGWGKTTLMNFIKAMFYGLGKNIKGSLRQKYLPWNQKECGGSIIFIHNDIEYRIERIFKVRSGLDILNVYNYTANKKEDIAEPGEYFFDMNEATFENTFFVNQQKLEIDGNDSQLQNGLVNTIEEGNSLYFFEFAQKNLKDFMKKETNIKEKKSNISKIYSEKIELERKLNDYKRLESEMQNNVSELSKVQEKLDYYKKLNEDLKIYINEKNDYDIYTEYQKLKQEEITITIDEELEIDLNDVSMLKTTSKPDSWLYYILIGLIVILAVVLGLLVTNWLFALSIFALLPLYLLLKVRKKYEETTKDVSQRLRKFQDKYQTTDIETIKKIISDRINFQKEKMIKHESIKHMLQEYENRYDIAQSIKKGQSFVTNATLEKELLDAYTLQDKIVDCSTKIARLKTLLEQHEKTGNQYIQINQEIAKLTEIITLYDNYNNYASEALDYLQSAYDDMHNNFTPQLKNIYLSIVKEITSLGYQDYYIDKNLNLDVEVEGINRDSHLFSQGYKDLLFFALRIAIIEMLNKKQEQLFILLDDPFVNLDDNNYQNALDYLNKLQKKYQIIYFSCRKIKSCV